jgi:hypothetical protein
LEQVLKESKAVEIVYKSMQVLLHDDLADTHGQLLLNDGLRKNEFEIAYAELFEVFMLDRQFIH